MPRLKPSITLLYAVGLGIVIVTAFLAISPHADVPSDSTPADHSLPRPHMGLWHRKSGGWPSYFLPSADMTVMYNDKDGLVKGWDKAHELAKNAEGRLSRKDVKLLRDICNRHPIEDLIVQGHDKWEAMLARQSRTLPQAVIEYTRRYGRAPPRGFEVWWQYAKRNNIIIVDDYDQIDRDIAPYFALSPETFRSRRDRLKSTPFTYQINLSPTGPAEILGERGMHARPRLLFSLLEPIAQLLPANVTIYGSDHDLGSAILGDDQKQAALTAIAQGIFLSDADLKPFEVKEGRGPVKKTASACPVDSLAWNQSLALQSGLQVEEPSIETSFIHDQSAMYDFCDLPYMIKHHGSLSWDFARDTQLRPLFQWSKFSRNPELLATPLEAYENHTDSSAQAKFVPWEDKTINKVFWRGSTTGDSYTKKKDWRLSHRPRLHLKAQERNGTSWIWVKRGREWQREQWSNAKLNDFYLDVGFAGSVHQCNEDDGTCDEMANELVMLDRVRSEQSAQYKYSLDLDGNGWSSRFHRLMMSGSVVIKSTIYPEWFSDWLIPWVHYILDYSDLYSIMSFFAGSPDSRGVDHDDLARAIAEQARSFGENHWRWEDMQGYMLRFLLEYARLQADDRASWVHSKDYS